MPRLPVDPDEGRPSPDLRAPVLALSAWAGGLAILRLSGSTCLVLLAVAGLWLVTRAWIVSLPGAKGLPTSVQLPLFPVHAVASTFLA